MLQKIIDTIEAELEKNKDNRMMRLIGDYVIAQCEKSSAAAEAVSAALDNEKTIGGAVKAMEDKARENAGSGASAGFLTDEEGYNIVKEYFGIGKTKSEKVVSIFDLM